MRAFIAVAFLFLFPAVAAAQSCNALRSQLATAQAGKPNAKVIASLTKRAKSFNCGSGGRAGRHHNCTAINAQLRQAKAGVVNRGRIRRLNRQIAAHCGEPRSRSRQRQARQERGGNRQAVRRNEKGNRRNIFSAIFGRGNGRNDREVQTASVNPRSGVERYDLNQQQKRRSNARRANASGPLATGSGRRGRLRVGNARTMCVRLCDGFYFPINSRSHSDNYYDELAMCVGRCPGADVSLYVHNAGEAVERMRSTMTGEAYVNLPTAFDYRKNLRPGCGCTNGTRIVRGGDGTPSAVTTASASPAGTVADTAKDNARWTPFRAVYDGTGEPLRPSLTAHGAARTTNVEVARARAKEKGVLPPPPTPSQTTGAVTEEPVALAELNEATAAVREVGPQFFSQTVAQFSATKQDSIRKRKTRGVPTVITVTPLRTDDGERAHTPAADEGDTAASIPAGTSAMVARDKSGG